MHKEKGGDKLQYLGSKSRISSQLVAILQSHIDTYSISQYVEPFVGGANVIDKVKCGSKVGYDINKYLIALLNKTRDSTCDFPETISKDDYCSIKENKDNYPDWLVGLVGFCGSYSAKWFGGYAKGNDTRDRQNEAIRNLISQSENLKDCSFVCVDYQSVSVSNALIYCDPPYKGTTGYKDLIDYNEYYNWCREMSKNNLVFCSEYSMPDDFVCVWEKQHKTLIDCNRDGMSDSNKRVEKLFIHSCNLEKYIHK